MEDIQQKVLAWALYAPDEEKIVFMKAFIDTCSVEVLSSVRNIVRRQKFYKKRDRTQEELKKADLIMGFEKKDIVSLDVEKVETKKGTGIDKIKAASIGFCDFFKKTKKITIKHEPNSFITNS